MALDDGARERLAIAMDQRRVELRLKWNQVAQRANMSIAHLSRIRSNETPLSDLAKVSLEVALDWPRGEIDRTLAGESPAEVGVGLQPPTTPADADAIGVDKILAILEVQRREIAELRERDAERQAEMQRLSEEIDRRHARGDTGHDRRKGA